MDRNLNPDGMGKYAILNLRKLIDPTAHPGDLSRFSPEVLDALATLEKAGGLEWGITGKPDEFFLIKLKDFYAMPALNAYAGAIEPDDAQFAAEVREMAQRSGVRSPHCKRPD
jgi:hypothetical protein